MIEINVAALAGGIAVVSAIVTATLFIAARPSRKEVNEMIDKTVDAKVETLTTKIDSVEKDVTEVKGDVKTLLQRTARQNGRKR